MAPKALTRHQVSSGLSYVAQKPSFLQNFGQRPPSPPPAGRFAEEGGSGTRSGREPLPERPREGKWAAGSDDEDESGRKGRGKGEDSEDDEWGEVYGGGGDDGPQVVVLKEGRHLDADQVKKERRRAAGKPSTSPEPVSSNTSEKDKKNTSEEKRPKVHIQKPTTSSSKRKLVGNTENDDLTKAVDGAKGDKIKKKKKKMDKGLLSFNEVDGEA